jgi:hypothetical protein
VIGNKWDTYLDLLQAEYEEGCVNLRVELLQPTMQTQLVCSCRSAQFSHQLSHPGMHAQQPSM